MGREGDPGQRQAGLTGLGSTTTKRWEPVIFYAELETDETQGGRVGVQGRKQLRQGCLRSCSPQDSGMVRWDVGQNERAHPSVRHL